MIRKISAIFPFLFLCFLPLCAQENEERLTFGDMLKRAEELQQAKKYRKAIVIFDSLIAIKPDEVALYNRGLCFFRIQEYDSSMRDMNQLIGINPKNQMAYYTRMVIFERLKKYETALKEVEFMLTLEIDSSMEMKLLKDHTYMLKRTNPFPIEKSKLCPDYERLHELDPENLRYYSDMNYYCNDYGMTLDPVRYIPVQKITQSTDQFQVVMKTLTKRKHNWYDKRHKMSSPPELGTYVEIVAISEKYGSPMAIAKVTKISGNIMEFEVMCWIQWADNEPKMSDFEYKDMVVAW